MAQPQNLARLKSFALSIGPQSEASNKCGFTRQWLQERTRSALQRSRLVFVDIDQPPDALIEVIVTTLPGHCIATVSVEVSTHVRMPRSGATGMATVWSARAIGGDLAVRNNFEGLVKNFLDEWNSVNR